MRTGRCASGPSARNTTPHPFSHSRSHPSSIVMRARLPSSRTTRSSNGGKPIHGHDANVGNSTLTKIPNSGDGASAVRGHRDQGVREPERESAQRFHKCALRPFGRSGSRTKFANERSPKGRSDPSTGEAWVHGALIHCSRNVGSSGPSGRADKTLNEGRAGDAIIALHRAMP